MSSRRPPASVGGPALGGRGGGEPPRRPQAGTTASRPAAAFPAPTAAKTHTDRDQDHVARHVELLVIGVETIAGQRTDELFRAEERPAVRMGRVTDFVEPPDHEAVGIVLGQPHLLEDDLALGVELALLEAR